MKRSRWLQRSRLTPRAIGFDANKDPGFLSAGSLASIAAAIVDSQPSLQMTWIWTFNNRGLFHLVQMLSQLLIASRIYISHQSAAYSH